MTSMLKMDSKNSPASSNQPLFVIVVALVANALIILGSVYVFSVIGGLDNRTQFGNLGSEVQSFIQFLTLLPAVMAIASSVLVVLRKSTGRFLSMVLYFVFAVLSVAAVLQSWGFFLSFELFVDTLMENAILLLGFPIAYGVFWFSGKMDPKSQSRPIVTQAAFIIGGLTVIALILVSDVINTINTILNSYTQLPTIIATVMAVVFGLLAWQFLKLGEYFGETPQQRTAWQGWAMLSPNIIGFTLFFAGPLLLSFYLSFTNSSVGQTPEFIGFENYGNILALEFKWLEDFDAPMQSVLTLGYSPLGAIQLGARQMVIGAKDAIFWISMRNTFLFCLMLVPLSTIPALGLSLVLNSKLPGVKFFRAVYFLPSVAAVVGTALIWRWLYDPTIGFFNYFITQIIEFLNSIGFQLTDPQIAWLTDPGVVLISIVFLAAWQVVGFNTVLFLAGLQGIPNVLYEAATVDGANRWQKFRNVTLPMLAPTTFFVIITTVITGLQVFNEPYALFPSRPLPVNATTSVYYLYDRGFPQGLFGYSSAIAWILFGIIFVVTFLQFRISSSNAYED